MRGAVGLPRPGRPRLVPDSAERMPREQVLDAAAALFAERGFAATSTRMIADRVGIQQASLYYYFASKDQILIELLTTSVRPSLEKICELEALVPEYASAAAALYTLALIDVDTLVRTPHNMGRLYLLPEIAHERYNSFRAERRELQETYGRLGTAAASLEVRTDISEARLGELLIQIAEVVIQLRQVREPDAADARAVADSCLRLCGLAEQQVVAARADAMALLRDTIGS